MPSSNPAGPKIHSVDKCHVSMSGLTIKDRPEHCHMCLRTRKHQIFKPAGAAEVVKEHWKSIKGYRGENFTQTLPLCPKLEIDNIL